MKIELGTFEESLQWSIHYFTFGHLFSQVYIDWGGGGRRGEVWMSLEMHVKDTQREL